MTPARVKKIIQIIGSKDALAKAVGVSARTVDGWMSRRPPSKVTARFIESIVRKSA